jgi:protein disulfide-isomerase
MKLLLVVILFAAAFATQAFADAWLTDYEKAVAQAKAEDKPILLDFTGSDWCGWCVKMKSDTLDTPKFKQYAKQNLVLMEVDFPHDKHQTDKVKEQNKKLAQQYDVHGYPCFVLVDKDGKELGRQGGYLAGGPKAFIEKLNTFYKPAAASKPTTGGGDFDKFFKKPAQTPNP